MRARLLLIVAGAVLPAVVALSATAQEAPAPSPPVGGEVEVTLVADGLTSPVSLVVAGDGSNRRFVVDQVGVIRVITADGTLLEEPFLDVRDRMVTLGSFFDERGLLGLAFHPRYADNGRFFVYYSAPLRAGAPADFNHTSHVSEFRVSSDPNRANPGSERILLQVDQPQFNHNAGDLKFGPDNMLYIALGDGGGGGDVGVGHTPVLGNAQDVTNLLGSILRIDVDGGDPYGIPADNPFVGGPGRGEIFAYGFRNPYRFTFDPGGHGLLVADAGQNLWEEVSQVQLGGNYGWNVKEGTHCFDPATPSSSPQDCPDTGPFGEPLIDPVIEYANTRGSDDGVGIVVVGGHVYRGTDLPELHGRYVFGDWSTGFSVPDGTLLVATPGPEGLWQLEELAVTNRPDGRLGHFVLGFGQDADGELYVLTSDSSGPSGTSGRVYRLANPNPDPTPEPHCVDLMAGRHTVAGEVCVTNDAVDLSVTYTTTDGWELASTHLHVARDEAGVPQNRAGNPTPGRFAYKASHEPGVVTYTQTIPLADLGAQRGDELVVAAKADVQRSRGGRTQTEGAWGDGVRFAPKGNWAMYFHYTVQ